MATTRPVLRWHGGKWRTAPWIISHFGPHQVYVEPFGGAASVLLRKPRSHAEVYNDLDDMVVGLFRVLQDQSQAALLLDRLRLTPFSRAEKELAYEVSADPIEEARRLIIRSFMGFGTTAHTRAKTGFRSNSNRSGTVPAGEWPNYPAALELVIDRLKGVVVESKDACEVMAQHDAPNTLHYVDPPYLPEVRSLKNPSCTKHRYTHELTTDQHWELLAFLSDLQGMVVLSGYPSDRYDEALPDWHRVEKRAQIDKAAMRTECLWLNPAAVRAMPAPDLLSAVA